jgi:2-hydroxy-3-keto-5-methylthiopentenyl-1-phosphate phosphatase
VSMAPAEAGSSAPRWAVLCDFDGTVAPVDVTDSLLVRFARPGWRELERAWEAGLIGSCACMAGQVALLDCSREELEAHVAGVKIDPDFKSFVAAVHATGASLTIVSDGLDAVIAAVLEREGLAHLPVRASRLVQTGARRWALEFPHARDDCRSAGATCKCAPASGDPAQSVLLIGDGASDFCAAAASDLSFARGRLLEHCVDLGLAHRRVDDFGAALVAWNELAATDRVRPMAVAAEDEE